MIGKETYRKISYEVIGDYAGVYVFLDQGDRISEDIKRLSDTGDPICRIILYFEC
jgi:hypothetical protein